MMLRNTSCNARFFYIPIWWMICVAIASCANNNRNPEEQYIADILDSFPADVSKDIIFSMKGKISENNRLVMTYTAPLVFTKQTRDSSIIEFVKGLDGDFYSSTSASNQKTGHMKAKYAIYYRKTKKMYLKGNVEIINQKNDVLRADDLWWDQQQRKVYTDGRVSFIQEGSKLYGIGFKSDEDMNEYEVNQLTGKIDGL